MGTLLKNGVLVTAEGMAKGDLRFADGKITHFGQAPRLAGDTLIDCRGHWILPGGVETHTHLDLEVMGMHTADDFLSGTRAALMGGTTTVLDFATAFRQESMRQGLANWQAKAEGRSHCDVGFHLALVDWNEALAGEMSGVVADGVSSFKFYLAYKDSLMVADDQLFEALRAAAECGATVGVHCENGDVIDRLVRAARAEGRLGPEVHAATRPPELEAEAVERFTTLARLAGARHYVVHLSTAEGLAAVQRARAKGADLTVETCPQYLLLDRSVYTQGDFYQRAGYVMSPPLREKEDQEALWRGLATGAIQFVGTDHCSFHRHGQKDHGLEDFTKIPNGAPGIELRLSLLYAFGVVEKRLTPSRFVEVVSTNAARYFGLYPQKGSLLPGADADLVVFDPAARWTVRSEALHEAVDYTPYAGLELTGKVRDVFLRGLRLVQDGTWQGGAPAGRYLVRGKGERVL